MKELTTKQIRKRVKDKDYSDKEWNQFELWKFVDYWPQAYINKWKTYVKDL